MVFRGLPRSPRSGAWTRVSSLCPKQPLTSYLHRRQSSLSRSKDSCQLLLRSPSWKPFLLLHVLSSLEDLFGVASAPQGLARSPQSQ